MSVGLMVGDRYELRERLGNGGFGTVWRARDETLHRDVAVKLRTVEGDDHPAVIARFWREARAVASLNDPNVVTAFDFGVHDTTAYLVMEFIAGTSLADELARRRATGFEIRRVVAIGAQVSSGLSAAHAAGLVHRDLKPANIMLVRATGHAKIVDFGIASVADLARLTGTGHYLGTLPYASPEQMSPGDVDGRSDLYSLGCVLYEMLTGASPYQAESPAQWIAAHQSAVPTPLRERLPSVPADLAALVHQLLAKDPADRPADADTVRARLDRIAATVGPPASTGVAASTREGTAHERTAHDTAGPVYATATPTLAMSPLAGRVRPLTSTVAGRLLMAFAVCCGLKTALAGAAVAAVARSVQHAFAGLDDPAGRDVVVYLMLIAIGWAVSTVVIGVLAGGNLHGGRAARVWTWLLAGPYAFVCLAGSGTADTLTAAATPTSGASPQVVVALSEVRHAIPGWYVIATSILDVFGIMAVIAAAVLLMSPATAAFTRARSEGMRRYPR